MVANHQPLTAPPPPKPETKNTWRVTLAQTVLMGHDESAGRLRQITQAIAVGVLGKKALGEYMAHVYETHASAYDPNHYQLDCEAKILLYLSQYHASGKLLSAFCGQGREAKFFADQGFVVTGIDASPAMIDGAKAYAQVSGFNARFEQVDFWQYTPTETNYDVIYLSPWMYGTFPDPADRLRLLHHCKAMLAPGGMIALSYIHLAQPQRLWEKLRHWLAVGAAILSGSPWRPRFGDRFYVGIFHHFFVPGELVAEVKAAGLQIVDQQESANGLFDFCLLSIAGRNGLCS